MDTQTQIDRLIELAIIQRSELKQLVEQLPQLREHLNAEVEKVFDETEPQLRAELEEWTTKQTADKTAALGVALEAKIADLAKSLEVSTQARYNAIIAEREENARLAAQAEAKIAEHAASLPSAVKDIVSAELARFPRAGEIDQLRKEFAEPRGLNPRGKWQAGETYNKLDLVTINGDSYTSNTDGNRTRPSRSSADWTLVAARGTGGGGGPTSLSELTTVPSDGDVLIGSGTSWVTSNLTAGAGISITVGPGAITISATDGDITLDDGTAASPSLHFTNDPDTGIYRPAANTLGISVSGTQVAYFDENGLTVPSAGVVAGGSIHAGNGNANNPSLSFDGDQDTGFFRHQPNEIGIALGGTQYATLTSTTFSITPVVTMASSLRVNGTTDSSSKDTGAIVTEGGLGVEKSATIGGNLTVSGTTASTFGPISRTNGTNATVLTLSDNLTGVSTTGYGLQIRGTSNNGGCVSAIGFENGGTGTNNETQFSVYTQNAANALTKQFTIGSTGNATLTGNLTVSGTGTSAFSGQISSTSAATASGDLRLNHSAGGKVIRWASANYNVDLYQSGDNDILRTRVASFQISSDPTFASNFTTIAAGNITTSGNLTVSGGTATISKSSTTTGPVLQLENTNDAIDAGGTLGRLQFYSGDDSGGGNSVRAWIDSIQTTATPVGSALRFAVANGANAAGEVLRIAETGNLLLKSDGVDSANGKIQLATHTTSAGGIGFGTDVSLFRSAAGVLRLASTSNYAHEIVNTGGTGAATTSYSNTGGNLLVGIDSSSGGALGGGAYAGVISRDGAYSLIFRTNNTTALTLDSSQHFKLTPAVASSITTTQSAPQIRMGSRASGRSNVVLDSTAGRVWSLENTGTSLTVGYSGLDAITIAETTGNATFAGQITASGISHKLGSGGTGSANALLTIDGSSASSYGPYIVLQRNSTNKWQFGTYSGINGGTSDDFLLYNPTAANEALKIAAATSNATFAGSIAIGNTVNTVSPTSPNRTITMVIGGTTYYIHAKTTND